MSHAVVALQEHAANAAESFCRRPLEVPDGGRFVQPPVQRRGKAVRRSRSDDSPPRPPPEEKPPPEVEACTEQGDALSLPKCRSAHHRFLDLTL
jgi:hypothetical protein